MSPFFPLDPFLHGQGPPIPPRSF
ncbi:hypothetical protein ACN42_g10448, partial [Penicillium freii]